MGEINILDKNIYSTKPVEGSNAQYNKGRVLESDSLRILGKKRSNNTNVEFDLYTLVTSQTNKNLTSYPNGILNGLGSEITIDYANISEDNAESDDGHYTGVKVAFYIYDGDTTTGKAIANAKTGNEIRTAIGQGDSFADTTDGNRVRYWKKGNQKQDTSMGDVITQDLATYGGQSAIPAWNDISNATDFPVENKSTVLFNTNIKKWTEHLTNKHSDSESNESYIWLVGRVSGDEREYALFGHGYLGLSGGYKTDERDREYIKLRIPKSELYNIWKNQIGETIEITEDYSTEYNSNSKYRGDLGKYTYTNSKLPNYRDNYGNLNGHNAVMDGWDPVNVFKGITVSVKAPTWSPLNSIKPIEDGGMNANWVNKTIDGYHCINIVDETFYRVGLNPKYDMDFVGFPSKFYEESNEEGKSIISGSGNYFSSSMVPDFRPISFISSSFDVDLQGYYDGETRRHQELRVQSSIPATVTLKLRLASDTPSGVNAFKPTYVDFTDDAGDYDNFNYYFFVVNWDWKDGEPETLEQIGEAFPINNEEFQTLVDDEGLYELTDIKAGGGVSYSDYLEPGIKIIKAVVLSTIDNNYSVEYSNFVQAVHWKLVTIKINLSNDGAQITSDFGDIGGDDFTYLPYPDVVNIPTAKVFFVADDDIDGQDWDAVTGGSDSGPGPPSNPTDGAYKSSHPIISGLSEESVYVSSLKKVNQVQPFGMSEIDERNSFERAKSLSPIGDMNEFGDYLGQSDISQVRFFNTGSFDMREMLDIQTVSVDGTNFYPHSLSSHWNGESNSFPKESLVGSIFISEYNYFKENCLVELNCGVLDGKTIKDTSGNGNKGILLGDYSIKKTKVGKSTTRDSYVKTPKTENKDGAY